MAILLIAHNLGKYDYVIFVNIGGFPIFSDQKIKERI
jgi:hypothetical protein